MRQPKMIYLWNFTCAFLFLAGRLQPQWLELSQEPGKAEYGSTSANDVLWSERCHQLNYPDCKKTIWLQELHTVFTQWSRTRLDVLATCQAGKAMEQSIPMALEGATQAHAGSSPQAQQCPQAKRINFKAGAQSQLWLWAVPKLICSLQSRSGTASPQLFCRLTRVPASAPLSAN